MRACRLEPWLQITALTICEENDFSLDEELELLAELELELELKKKNQNNNNQIQH